MTQHYEAEVIIGIEDIAIQELMLIDGIKNIRQIRNGFIRFEYDKSSYHLQNLKTVVAVYKIIHFDIPRPKALLGHENFTRLTDILNETLQGWDKQHYSFGLGAAGSNSSVMQRIKQEISQTLNIALADDEKGDLFLRLVPAHKKNGWEALIRLTPKPLATRSWRIANIPGALNGTVSSAMLRLAKLKDGDIVLNICSGTATILIEQAIQKFNLKLIALDNDFTMLQYAAQNIETSGTTTEITQILGEAQQTPLQTSSIDCIFADLPFGHHMGSHQENEWLYPAILDESARLCKTGGQFIVITHELQLMEDSLISSQWKTIEKRQINLNGLHPQIFVLERI